MRYCQIDRKWYSNRWRLSQISQTYGFFPKMPMGLWVIADLWVTMGRNFNLVDKISYGL